MATGSRRPYNIGSRSTAPQFSALGSPQPSRSTIGTTFSRSVSSTSIKRARSPDHRDTLDTQAKRLKPVPPSPTKRQPSAQAQVSGQPPLTFSPKANASRDREEDAKRREQKRAERDAQKEEFRVKYSRAFPGWTFHIDDDVFGPEESLAKKRIEDRLTKLGAVRVIFHLYHGLRSSLPMRFNLAPDCRSVLAICTPDNGHSRSTCHYLLF